MLVCLAGKQDLLQDQMEMEMHDEMESNVIDCQTLLA